MDNTHEDPRVIKILQNFETKLISSVREMVRELEIEILSSPLSTSLTPTLTNSTTLFGGLTFDSGMPTPVKLRHAGSTPYPRQWSTPNNEGACRQSESENYVFQTTEDVGQRTSKDITSSSSILVTDTVDSRSRSLTPRLRARTNFYESDHSLSPSSSEESTRSLPESLKRKIMSDFDEKRHMIGKQSKKRMKTESFDADVTPKFTSPPIMSTRRVLTFKHANSFVASPHRSFVFDEPCNHAEDDSSVELTLAVDSTSTSPDMVDFTFSSSIGTGGGGGSAAGDLSCFSEGDDDVFAISATDVSASDFGNYSWIQETPVVSDDAVDIDISAFGSNFATDAV